MNKPRRAKSRRLLPLPLDENETKCGICLDDVVKRGKIGPCSHLYCFSCLLEWSKLNNTCPQCKLTFRCITRVDFATDSFEEKVFIKDKTLRTGHVSSDDDSYVVNSSEIDDSDPDFIDNSTQLPPPSQAEEEDEAVFTQQQRHGGKRKRRRRVWSESSSGGDENDVNYRNILNQCRNSDLKSPAKLPITNGDSRSPVLHRVNNGSVKSPKCSPTPCSSKTRTMNNGTPPRLRHGNDRKSQSPKTRPNFTSPIYKKEARWARLDQRVRNSKRKRTLKRSRTTKAPPVSINTISSESNSSVWLTTRSSKEEPEVKKQLGKKFNVPFKKSVTSPEPLYENPEEYFASIIDSEI